MTNTTATPRHPFAKHDCDSVHRFDVDFNRSVVPVGTVWTCPTCNSQWLRTQEEFKGVLYLMGYKPVIWTRLNWVTKHFKDAVTRNAPTMVRISPLH